MRTKLTALACLITLLCSAQKNFKKGFIVTNTSDTLWGYINYIEQRKNPTFITFKKQIEDSEAKKYTLQDIQYFEINGYEYFYRYNCKISEDPVNLTDITTEEDTTSKITPVFLRSLVLGKNVQLYSYEDDLKNRFFIKSVTDSIPKELSYKIYFDQANPILLVEKKGFQNQLMHYALIYNAPSNFSIKAEKSSYKESDLIELVNILNGGSNLKFENAKKQKSSRLFIQGGLDRSYFRFVGHKSVENIKFSPCYSPYIGLGIDVFANPSIGKLLLRQELLFFSKTFTGTEDQSSIYYYDMFSQYELKQNTLASNSSIIHNIYNTAPLKMYLGAGIALNYSKYPKNKYYQKESPYNSAYEKKPYELNAFYSDAIFRAGVVLKNKVEASIVASYPISNTTNYIFFKDKQTSQQLRIGYLFRSKKM